MTPGHLKKNDDEATIGPRGWDSANPDFADALNATWSVGGSPAAGYPWVRAFWDAVEGLGAEALVEPEPDPAPPDTVF